MKYLDESGFGLSLPISYSWARKGQSQQRQVPKYFGGSGRINVIGALDYAAHQLEYALLESKCSKQAVLAFLQTQAQQANQRSKLTVLVLDNASFHRAKIIQDKIPHWQQQNLYLRYLPPYSPQLNPIETVWKRLKTFLLPRRYYSSLTDLKQALLQALHLFKAFEVII